MWKLKSEDGKKHLWVGKGLLHWKGISFDPDPKVGIPLLPLGHRANHMSSNIKCDVIDEWLTYVVQTTKSYVSIQIG